MSLQALIVSSTALVALALVPPAQLQPCQLPVPSHPSCPCAAGWRPAGGIQRWPAAGAGRADRPWHGVGAVVGGKGRLIFLYSSGSMLVVSCHPCYSALLRCAGITMQPRENTYASRNLRHWDRVAHGRTDGCEQRLAGSPAARAGHRTAAGLPAGGP